ncbi:MAG: flagellar export chaperone FliS [Rubrivivax sp.]|nr:flagellar export chaperone FliS [Rubrivivax sp.]
MFFSSPYAAGRSAPVHAYQRTAIDVRAAQADPHQLVVMLFDGFFEALAQARGAMRNGDLAAKGRALGKAVSIIDEGLRAALDLRQGGPLARDLHDLYAYVTMRLTRANLSGDEAALDECAELIQPLAQAWASIRPQTQNAPQRAGA